MIAFALAALAQAAPAPDEDIIVVACKMWMIGVDMKAPRRDGRLVLESCRISHPSGYPEIDAVPCEVARSCIADGPTSRKLLASCVEERSRPRLDAILDRWRGFGGERP